MSTAFNVKYEIKPYQRERDGRWVVRPCSPRDWRYFDKSPGPRMRVWQLSKHSWRWFYSDPFARGQGRATTKDQAVQAVIRFRKYGP